MADTLTSTLTAILDYTFNEALDLSTVSDTAQLKYEKTFQDGTGASQCDIIWHDQITVSGSGTTELDLGALSRTLYGDTDTIALAKVKMIMIENTDVTAADDVYIDSSLPGTGKFIQPFNASATTKIEIPASSALVLANKVPGWTVTTTTDDTIHIANDSANDVILNVVIVGTTA